MTNAEKIAKDGGKGVIDADKLKQHYAWWGEEDEKKRQFDLIVDLQPTVEPPAKKAKAAQWVPGDSWSEGFGMGEIYGLYYKCSSCGEVVKGWPDRCQDNFCRGCGADMR